MLQETPQTEEHTELLMRIWNEIMVKNGAGDDVFPFGPRCDEKAVYDVAQTMFKSWAAVYTTAAGEHRVGAVDENALTTLIIAGMQVGYLMGERNAEQ